MRPDTKKDSLETFVEEILDREVLAERDTFFERHTKVADGLNLAIEHVPWLPVWWNSHRNHAARQRQSLKNRDRMPKLIQVIGSGRRPRGPLQ